VLTHPFIPGAPPLGTPQCALGTSPRPLVRTPLMLTESPPKIKLDPRRARAAGGPSTSTDALPDGGDAVQVPISPPEAFGDAGDELAGHEADLDMSWCILGRSRTKRMARVQRLHRHLHPCCSWPWSSCSERGSSPLLPITFESASDLASGRCRWYYYR
jgi:hypothetical protein